MNEIELQIVKGVIVRGHRVASGLAADSPYPRGSIEMQMPFFAALGLDLTGFYLGTINVSIEPDTFEAIAPQYTFKNVEWTHLHPPENFSFSACEINFKGIKYPAWIYYPHPETKRTHFQNPSLLELIAPFIPGIADGESIEIGYDPRSYTITATTDR